jgi:hypothetical protein
MEGLSSFLLHFFTEIIYIFLKIVGQNIIWTTEAAQIWGIFETKNVLPALHN